MLWIQSVGNGTVNKCEALVEWYRGGESEVPAEEPVPLQLHSQQISHGLAW